MVERNGCRPRPVVPIRMDEASSPVTITCSGKLGATPTTFPKLPASTTSKRAVGSHRGRTPGENWGRDLSHYARGTRPVHRITGIEDNVRWAPSTTGPWSDSSPREYARTDSIRNLRPLQREFEEPTGPGSNHATIARRNMTILPNGSGEICSQPVREV